MLNMEEVRRLMAGRAGVSGLLSDMFADVPDMEDIKNLCRYLEDLTRSIELQNEEDDLLSGYRGLKRWYDAAKSVDRKWIENKLAEEFAFLFRNQGESIGVIFADSYELEALYAHNGYAPERNPGDLSELLSFLCAMSMRVIERAPIDEVKKSAAIQKDFIEKYISPKILEFCGALYERAPEHGVYQYLAVILHGYAEVDEEALKYLEESL